MIWIFYGKRGSGKTLSMVQKAREFLLKNPNYKVITNTPFKAKTYETDEKGKKHLINANIELIENKAEYFNKFETEIYTLFLLDEAGSWLSNYSWKIIPESVYTRFEQVRKAHIHMMATVPHFEFVANKLRQQTDSAIEVIPIPRVNPMSLKEPKKPWIIQHVYWNPVGFEKNINNDDEMKKYIYGRRFILRMKETLKSFDTDKIIKNK
jgi:hypothetical protein